LQIAIIIALRAVTRESDMSATARVQQWLTFNRLWWLFDAKWQDPYKSATIIAKYLEGLQKPIHGGNRYGRRGGAFTDCGDHVVIINSEDIALYADEWYYRVYFHHTGYPGGASWTKAYEVHDRDPTKIIEKAVKKKLPKHCSQPFMARLHIFKDDKIPEKIAQNISDQIRPLRPIPKRLDHYSKQEVENFPKLFEFPKDYHFPNLKKVPTPRIKSKEEEATKGAPKNEVKAN